MDNYRFEAINTFCKMEAQNNGKKYLILLDQMLSLNDMEPLQIKTPNNENVINLNTNENPPNEIEETQNSDDNIFFSNDSNISYIETMYNNIKGTDYFYEETLNSDENTFFFIDTEYNNLSGTNSYNTLHEISSTYEEVADRPSKRRKIDTTHPQSEEINESLVLPGPSWEFNPSQNSTVIEEESSPEKTLPDLHRNKFLYYKGKRFKVRCPMCNKLFGKVLGLKKHLLSQVCIRVNEHITIIGPNYHCKRCDFYSRGCATTALTHVQDTHNVGHSSYSCHVCDKKIQSANTCDYLNDIKKHVDNNHPDFFFLCFISTCFIAP